MKPPRSARHTLLASLAQPVRAFALAGLASFLLAGCFHDEDTPASNSQTTTPTTTTGTVTGRVFNNSTGISGATVSIGSISGTTDSSGNFTLTGVTAATRAVVKVTKTGYAETFKNTSVTANTTTSVTIEPLPVGTLASGNSFTAQAVVAIPNSPAQVTIPANGLVRADGSAVSGTYSVALTAIAPASNSSAMPGEFLAATGSTTAPIESWGALSTTLSDSAGAKLQLASGRTATIRIPVSTRSSTIPASIPLFYFNETTGLWVQEGTATLAGTAPNQYYEGTVTHFSVWNADQVTETVYINGCVADSDGTTPVANVRVSTDGIDYSGASSGMTDAQGNFRLAVKRAGRATVTGLSGLRLTNTLSVGPYTAAENTLPSCLRFSATSAASASIKLTWGTDPHDVDSHLYTPSGFHLYYSTIDEGSLTAAPYAALDVDDTGSFGPEVITLTRLMVGTYTYALHNFSGTNPPGLTGSPVRVEFSRAGSTSVYTPGAGETVDTDYWTVFSFTVSANCTITETPVNTWSASSPSTGSTTTPTYCTP